jgi:hypothetical protein
MSPVVYFQNYRRTYYVPRYAVMPRYRNVNINIYRVDRSRFRRIDNPTFDVIRTTSRPNSGFRNPDRNNGNSGGFRNNGKNNNSGFRNESNGNHNGGFRGNSENNGGFRDNSNNNGGFRNNGGGGFRNENRENNNGGFRGNSEVRREVPHQEIMADSEETVVASEKNLKVQLQLRTVVTEEDLEGVW